MKEWNDCPMCNQPLILRERPEVSVIICSGNSNHYWIVVFTNNGSLYAECINLDRKYHIIRNKELWINDMIFLYQIPFNKINTIEKIERLLMLL